MVEDLFNTTVADNVTPSVSVLATTELWNTKAAGDSFRITCIQVFFVFCYFCYGASIVFGIPCNLYVICRMYRLTARCTNVRNGSSICLLIMSVADIMSLSTIGAHLAIRRIELPYSVKNIICKVVLFSTHFATSASIWCWLLLSTMRYLSIHRPFLYLRIWKLPIHVLLVLISTSAIANIWLLFSIDYGVEDGKCRAEDLFGVGTIKEVFLLTEMIWSFCIPSAIIIYADASAIWCWAKLTKLQKTSSLSRDDFRRICRTSSAKKVKMSKRLTWRWLCLALIDVVLNAPENIIRFCTIIGVVTENSPDTTTYYMLRVFSQVLYYSQFSFNCLYLALFIYDKCTKPSDKSNTSCNAVRVTVRKHSTAIDLSIMQPENGQQPSKAF